MSRDIRFRAWDKETKKMADVGFTLIWENCREAFGISLISKFDERIEFMQYTGLHDKNGVEIYEGDICEVDLLEDRRHAAFPGEVSGRHKAVIEIDPANLIFKFGGYGNYITSYYVYEAIKSSTMEVIGNIYENPELLREQA